MPVQGFGQHFEELTAEYLSYVRGYVVYKGFVYQTPKSNEYVGTEVRYPSDVDIIGTRPNELLLVSCTENLPTKLSPESGRGRDIGDRLRQLDQALPYVEERFGRYKTTKRAIAYLWMSSFQNPSSVEPGVELISFKQMLNEVIDKMRRDTSDFKRKGAFTEPMLWLIARLYNRPGEPWIKIPP